MNKIEFKPEHLKQFQDLYLELSFSGKTLNGTFGSNKLSPYDFLNFTNVGGCKAMLATLRKQLSNLEPDGFSQWEVDTEQTSAVTDLKTWIEFVNLCIGYKIDKEQKLEAASDLAEQIKRLEIRIAKEADKNKTLTDLQDELKKLKGE